MNGVCTRFAILRKSNHEPMEGGVYTDRAKANRRLGNTANGEQFYVGEVAVMPIALARRLADAVSNSSASPA